MTCTHRPSGYEIFFNRDEQRSRKPAEAPILDAADGVSFIAPRDGNHGGTWLAANEFGLTVGVLNFYQAEKSSPSRDLLSRGRLPILMASSASIEAVEENAAAIDAQRYRPFLLFAVDRKLNAYTVSWDGSVLSPGEDSFPARPISTSSFSTNEVIEARMKLFDHMAAKHGGISSDWLSGYHASHLPSRSAFSVCMHRDDARTVSFSHIIVDTEQIEFRYFGCSPCEAEEPLTATLPLRL
ncbi:MAG: NRDE family protein [Verrucomicrobia bacterium]|nr:NRDE family protein [Verrucomicrobiota bacterium]